MKVINRQARFNYEVKERVEAGIVLTGAEAKSAKLGAVDMGNAYVKIRHDTSKTHLVREAWVLGMHIYPYKHADNTNYDPTRSRKLLLHQKELMQLEMTMKSNRLLLIPTALYTKSGRIKLELALARGKRIYEKRETIKKRDLEREER